jgi:hypothetical protein
VSAAHHPSAVLEAASPPPDLFVLLFSFDAEVVDGDLRKASAFFAVVMASAPCSHAPVPVVPGSVAAGKESLAFVADPIVHQVEEEAKSLRRYQSHEEKWEDDHTHTRSILIKKIT